MSETNAPINSSKRPPIVAVLGHVDHGKTTLLDSIRKTSVAAREHGGITQHIGAYQINIKDQKSKIKSEDGELITFIDTPGHEAFMKMRARGARVADIAVLVVAADDSVKPQTKESIRIIKEASIPMIVAINKIDLPSADVERVKQDLARSEVQVEGFGGEVPMVLISANTRKGIPELLTAIANCSRTMDISGDASGPVSAVVVETHVDKGRGMVATVIVKIGTLTPGKELFDGEKKIAKVRAMFDEFGNVVSDAPPGKPVEVLGFTALPPIGEILTDSETKKATVPSENKPQPVLSMDFLTETPEKKSLKIIIKTDTAGSLEAILASLGPGAEVVSSGIGDVSEADVLLAKSTGSFIIGFHTKIPSGVAKLAETEGVVLRNYTIIYELLDELTEALSGMQEVLTKERELGVGSVIAEFPYDGKRVAGVKISSGRLARGDQAKVMRGEIEVAKAKIKSIRKGKEDVTKAEAGAECGVLFDGKVDFELGDAIIAFVRS